MKELLRPGDLKSTADFPFNYREYNVVQEILTDRTSIYHVYADDQSGPVASFASIKRLRWWLEKLNIESSSSRAGSGQITCPSCGEVFQVFLDPGEEDQ